MNVTAIPPDFTICQSQLTRGIVIQEQTTKSSLTDTLPSELLRYTTAAQGCWQEMTDKKHLNNTSLKI